MGLNIWMEYSPFLKIIEMTFTKYCKNLSLVGLCFFMNFNSSAQILTAVDDFSIFKIENGIYLKWTLTTGSICNGIQIYRSTDSVIFLQIGEIPGICGSSIVSRSYTYIDNNPVKNKTNYYRLDFGGSGVSEILSLEIIDIQNGEIQIRPHPVIDKASIYFNNDKNEAFQLTLYNLSGYTIYTAITTEKFFQIDSEPYNAGIYFFSIALADGEGSKKKTIGKLIVQ